MKYDGTTYRPPVECDSVLLQVTVGCAHNTCTFCNMYRDVAFSVESMEQIEKDLVEARGIYPNGERVFLVNGDAFVLKTEKLKAIAEMIHKYFPENKVITMYASIRNIKAKTDQELKELNACGINDLYVGVESGSDQVLAYINKGTTVEEAKTQLHRLNNAGINHLASLMIGVGGKGKGLENARLTAAFLNDTKPALIWIGTLALFSGTPMHGEMVSGHFSLASELEILQEEKELIERIGLYNVPVYGVHPTNAVPVKGVLPWDRQKMIETLDKGIERLGEGNLTGTFLRATL